MSKENKENQESNFLEYSLDKDLNKEYEEFNKKFTGNKKNLIIANSALCYGIFCYFKKYHKRIFDRQRGVGKNFLSAILHSFGTIILICTVDAVFLGLTPANIKKRKEFEDKLMYQSNYQINYELFKDIIDDDSENNNNKKNDKSLKV
jgi:hypothetical protein